jgi:hypothetical protein
VETLDRLYILSQPPLVLLVQIIIPYRNPFDRDSSSRSRCYERSHLYPEDTRDSDPREVRAAQYARMRLHERREERLVDRLALEVDGLEVGQLFLHGVNGARATEQLHNSKMLESGKN